MADEPAPGTGGKGKPRGAGDALRKLRDIVSLTHQEQMLILCVLLSIVLGAAVKHCRRVHRETHPVTAPSPTPSLRAKDIYLLDKEKTR